MSPKPPMHIISVFPYPEDCRVKALDPPRMCVQVIYPTVLGKAIDCIDIIPSHPVYHRIDIIYQHRDKKGYVSFGVWEGAPSPTPLLPIAFKPAEGCTYTPLAYVNVLASASAIFQDYIEPFTSPETT